MDREQQAQLCQQAYMAVRKVRRLACDMYHAAALLHFGEILQNRDDEERGTRRDTLLQKANIFRKNAQVIERLLDSGELPPIELLKSVSAAAGAADQFRDCPPEQMAEGLGEP